MYRMLVLCSVVAGVAAAPVPAQDSVDQSRRNAIVQAIEKAAPAVVSINVVETRAEVPPMFRDFYEFFDLPSPRQRVEAALSWASRVNTSQIDSPRPVPPATAAMASIRWSFMQGL